MTIDVEAFGFYVVMIVVVAGAFMWALSPLFRKDKKEEPKLDPVPEPVVNKAQEEVKVNIDAKTEEIFAKVLEEAAKTNTPVAEAIKEVVATVEPVKIEAPKAKKSDAKKEKTFIPAAAPKPKASAKKTPAKKVTKK
jgi:hypothetical protein